MPAAPSTFSRIRFSPAGVLLPDVASSASILEIPRPEGLALLEWLGLGRPDFGAIAARELAPRCRRRLWSVERNADPALRVRTTELLAVAETAGEGMVLFG
jgi:hypothetical protein